MDIAFFEPFDQCNLNIGPGEGRAADAAQPARCHCLHPVKAFIGVFEPDEVETADVILGAMTEHGAQTPVQILIEGAALKAAKDEFHEPVGPLGFVLGSAGVRSNEILCLKLNRFAFYSK